MLVVKVVTVPAAITLILLIRMDIKVVRKLEIQD